MRGLGAKVARRLARWRRRIVAHRRPRPRKTSDSTGLDYVRVRRAATVSQARRQLRRAAWTASRRNPELLILAPGRYVMPVRGVDGLDIMGDVRDPAAVTIAWDGLDDTINVSGVTTRLNALRVLNGSRDPRYAIHADGPGPGAIVELVNVTARSYVKGALGLGLFGGQQFRATGCDFTRESADAHAPAAVLTHNWIGQTEPCSIEFVDCTATAPDYGVGFQFTDLGSGQRDTIRWTGGALAGGDGPHRIDLTEESLVDVSVITGTSPL